MLGYITIEPHQVNLQAKVRRHLGNGFEPVKKYHVARHHYHPEYLKLRGNKSMVINPPVASHGAATAPKLAPKSIGAIEGTPGWMKIDKVLSTEEAATFGLQDPSERVTGGFMIAPLYPLSSALSAVEDATSRRAMRQQAKDKGSVADVMRETCLLEGPSKLSGLIPSHSLETLTVPTRQVLTHKIDYENPASFVIHPKLLAGIIKKEVPGACKPTDDGALALDFTNSQNLQCALFLYTRYFGQFDTLEVPHPEHKTLYLRPCNLSLSTECTSFRVMKAKGKSGLSNVCNAFDWRTS